MDRHVEHALIRRARHGDRRAVEELIRGHQDALYAFILRMSGRPEVAEDIVQEAFVRVLRNLRRFDSRFRFNTWVFTIAKRLYMNWSQKLGPAYDSDAIGLRHGRGPGPDQASAEQESTGATRRAIDQAIAGLPSHQGQIIVLFHRMEWPIARIAEYLDMPQGTVKSHLHRGRLRMKRHLLIECGATVEEPA